MQQKNTSFFTRLSLALLLTASLAACNNDKKEEPKEPAKIDTPAAPAPVTTDTGAQAPLDTASTRPVKTVD